MVRHTTSSKEVIDLLIAWLGVSFAFYLAFSRPDFTNVSLEYVLATLTVPLLVVGKLCFARAFTQVHGSAFWFLV
jgi:hypothetical protein